MIRIEIYADVVCPWCYIGETRLERALQERPRLEVTRTWRPFQLQPDVPKPGLPWSEFVDSKFGGAARAEAAFKHVKEAGAEDGLEFNFDRVASMPNTVDAHRLILWAGEQGREDAMSKALFRAYFTEGKNVGDPAQLVEIATAQGLEGAKEFLAGDRLASEVVRTQHDAAELGIQGVPFFVFNGKYALSGAQPLKHFVQVLDELVKRGEA